MSARTLAWLALGACASTASSRAAPDGGLYELEVKPVAEGIYVLARPEPLRTFVEGNVTVIINDRDVVVVDAGGAPRAARNAIAAIKRLTPHPVTYVVNTHIHKDHRFGLQEYVKAYPGVEIVAHPAIRDIILATSPKYMTDTVARIEAPPRAAEDEIARLRREAKPGDDRVIAHLERYTTRDIHAIRREYRTVVNVPPTLTVDHALVLHRGKRRIEIRHLGHGDTPQDLIVYLPDDKVVCTGDMVVHPVPYGFSDEPLAWLATLGKLAELDFDRLVPGHGEVQQGKAYLTSVIELLRSVQDQLRGTLEAGLDLAAARARVDVSGFEAGLGGDPVARYYFKQYFVDPSVERMWKALAAAKR